MVMKIFHPKGHPKWTKIGIFGMKKCIPTGNPTFNAEAVLPFPPFFHGKKFRSDFFEKPRLNETVI
jgi:hypothetical protein